LRFEVQYPHGEPHEVELQGTVAILGRDPSCDLVLNDSKCSRRHAVLEAGPQGIAIRDTGSANGVFVNGRKVERSPLAEGDVVRLGEVRLTVLSEDVPGTLVMGPEDLDHLQQGGAAEGPRAEASAPAAAPPSKPAGPPLPRPAGAPPPRLAQRPVEQPPRAAPPAPPPRPVPPRAASPEGSRPPQKRPAPPREPVRRPALVRPAERPLTVTVLAGLWAASVLLYGAGGLALASSTGWTGGALAAAVTAALLLAIVSAVMAVGLWTCRPWARVLQILGAGLGILTCAFTLSSITVLVYMLRPAVAARFAGQGGSPASQPVEADADTSAEAAFTIAILGTVLLGAALVAAAALVSSWIERAG